METCAWPTWVQWFWILEASPTVAAILSTVPVIVMGIIMYRLQRRK